MKKILLATTILSVSAGFAAADVAISGSGKMGVVATDGASVFKSGVDITFKASGTTDAGLAFGGKFDSNNSIGADAGVKGSVFISGAFGKISMGDVAGGDAAAVGQLASVGYTGLGSGNSINYASDGFDLFGLPAKVAGDFSYEYNYYDDADLAVSTVVLGGAPAKVLYTYSAGGLTVDASAGQISNGPADHNSYGLGVAYTTGGLTLAAGYGSNEFSFATTATATLVEDGDHGTYTENLWSEDFAVTDGSVTDSSISATYVMGDTTIKAIYQDKQVDATYDGEDAVAATATSMGLSVVHKIGAVTLTAFGVSTDLSSDVTGGEDSVAFTRTGLGVAYDLGGGASLKAGAVNVEVPHLTVGLDENDDPTASLDTASYTAYDVGVNFSF